MSENNKKIYDNIQPPEGLQQLLEEFTLSLLYKHPNYPDNLIEYAADYFNNLYKSQQADHGSPTVASTQMVHDENKGEDEDDDEDYDDFDENADERITTPPPKMTRRRVSVAAESFDPEAEDDINTERVVIPKSDEQRQRLYGAVKGILIFRSLEENQLSEVIDAMSEKHVDEQEVVIYQGDEGDNFYVLEKGHFEAVVADSEGKIVYTMTYEDHGYFGELALMYNTPRAATVTCVDPNGGIIWQLDRETFRRIVLKAAFLKRRSYEKLLETVSILQHLSVYERANVADALVSRDFEQGEIIINQNDDGHCMFFIELGEVGILRKDHFSTDEGELEEKEINVLKKGDYFGELALITHQKRLASAKANTKTRLAVLDVASFERLLGPCLAIMKRNEETYAQQLRDAFGSDDAISDLRGYHEVMNTQNGSKMAA